MKHVLKATLHWVCVIIGGYLAAGLLGAFVAALVPGFTRSGVLMGIILGPAWVLAGIWIHRRLRPVTPERREEVIAYYEKSVRITALQTREADRYNSALLIHMNSLNDSESAKTMIAASKRLALCGKECIRRHASLFVPDLAAADYVAWGLLYNYYSAWADAQHDMFVALSQGRTPFKPRVRELMDASEKQRKVAERASRNLLQLVGLKGQDVQRFMAAGQDATAAADWEPEGYPD